MVQKNADQKNSWVQHFLRAISYLVGNFIEKLVCVSAQLVLYLETHKQIKLVILGSPSQGTINDPTAMI